MDCVLQGDGLGYEDTLWTATLESLHIVILDANGSDELHLAWLHDAHNGSNAQPRVPFVAGPLVFSELL
jgi:hypothetical protein